VANARQLKWITASDTKNDPVDARQAGSAGAADVRLLAAGGAFAQPNNRANWR